jgi:hypothetical protein
LTKYPENLILSLKGGIMNKPNIGRPLESLAERIKQAVLPGEIFVLRTVGGGQLYKLDDNGFSRVSIGGRFTQCTPEDIPETAKFLSTVVRP